MENQRTHRMIREIRAEPAGMCFERMCWRSDQRMSAQGAAYRAAVLMLLGLALAPALLR
jgi:hypothetical protein